MQCTDSNRALCPLLEAEGHPSAVVGGKRYLSVSRLTRLCKKRGVQTVMRQHIMQSWWHEYQLIMATAGIPVGNQQIEVQGPWMWMG